MNKTIINIIIGHDYAAKLGVAMSPKAQATNTKLHSHINLMKVIIDRNNTKTSPIYQDEFLGMPVLGLIPLYSFQDEISSNCGVQKLKELRR